jgi:hypothetical protein
MPDTSLQASTLDEAPEGCSVLPAQTRSTATG